MALHGISSLDKLSCLPEHDMFFCVMCGTDVTTEERPCMLQCTGHFMNFSHLTDQSYALFTPVSR